jgi:hypothetical protein
LVAAASRLSTPDADTAGADIIDFEDRIPAACIGSCFLICAFLWAALAAIEHVRL